MGENPKISIWAGRPTEELESEPETGPESNHGGLYCPKCNKFVEDGEILPLVVEVMKDGTEYINRAAHWPGCATELKYRPRKGAFG